MLFENIFVCDSFFFFKPELHIGERYFCKLDRANGVPFWVPGLGPLAVSVLPSHWRYC